MRFIQGIGMFLWVAGAVVLVVEITVTAGTEVAPWLMGAGIVVGAIGLWWQTRPRKG